MRQSFLGLFFLSVALVSCKKSGESVSGEKSEEKAMELGKGPAVTWKILEDVPGSKPSHRGYYASYASTGVVAMDSVEQNFAKKFVANFKKPDTEMYQKEGVLVSNSKITGFFVRQYGGSGKIFYSHFSTRYYDSKSGSKLSVKNFFNNEKDFAKFTTLAKNMALQSLKKMISEDFDLKDEEKKPLLQSAQQKIATLATADFENVVFDKKNATVILPAEKIADPSYGKIFARIPFENIESLLSNDYKDYVISGISAKFLPPLTLNKEKNPSDSVRIVQTAPENIVALTFDDGPGDHTQKLLDILKEKDVKATFFVVGRMAEHYKSVLKKIHAEGHQIANHSWDHSDFKKLSLRQIREQLDDTNAQIYDATGQLPSVFRPPYGSFTPEVRAVSDMPIMLWNIDPLDWKIRNTQRVMEQLSKGKAEDILLCHDIHVTTVNAIPQVIENLKAKNLKFVTVDQLFAGYTLKDGKPYAQKHKPNFYKITVDPKPALKK